MSAAGETILNSGEVVQSVQGEKSGQGGQNKTTKRQSRPHVYELDPMRIVTALSVVAVHVLAFSLFLEHTGTAILLHNAVLNALHFTRQVFMFVTPFALVYVYYGKPFSTKRFWSKRAIGVLLPYSIWSIIYTWVNTPKPFWPFVGTSLFNILTGSAAYQLYYILLSLQFYLVFPLFMLLLKRVERHPWKTLTISLVVQLLFIYVDYHYIQGGPFGSTPLGKLINIYQDRFILTYQFFFFLGAFAALYLQQVRAFILRHAWLVISIFLITTGWLWGRFFLQVEVYHENQGYVLSVLKPSIELYSIGIILLFCWLAALWARRTDASGHPAGYRFWHNLSDASFGVYLVHVLILNSVVLPRIVPLMPSTWPSVLSIFLIWAITGSASVLITLLLLRIPYASRLVGREHPKERDVWSVVRGRVGVGRVE